MEERRRVPHNDPMTDPTPTPSNRLTRPRQGRMIAGVAAAVANRAGVDVALVRLAFVVSLFFGGLGLIAYVAGWALIPEEGESQSLAEKMFGGS